MSTADNSSIHRYLDEAFTGIVMTPEVQDLKEEIRGNLSARLNELVVNGMDAEGAATTAIAELGDIRELVDQVGDDTTQPVATDSTAAYLVNRVRPKPAFVVTIVVAALAAAIAFLLATLSAIGVLPLPLGVIIALVGIGATGAAWVVGNTLAQETTTNYPMPEKRAGGYFLASLLAVYGLGLGGLIALGVLPVWVVVFAALGVVAAVVLFAFLGATQTNRKKQWVRAAQRQYQGNDRFSEDPAAAARFGMYTVVIWLLAFAAFVVLSITVGFLWSWLALLVGCVVFMLVLARMLFPANKDQK